ncbi:MAG: hypothetical protein GF401_19235 [Chitinivibrionales bacterium]|nr:hypothetical protein [Chitinivibrionales bacterium]
MKKFYALASVITASVLLFHCSDITEERPATAIDIGGPQMLVCTDDTLNLCWDAPDQTDSSNTIESYELCYREHDTGSTWTVIDTNISAGSTTCFTVSHADLGNGVFDFAVRSVAVNGTKSDYHTSIENTAIPSSGWFVRWDK